ncbi:hypothetical protein vBEcoMphAPEC6_00120 [Escherichia phage ph0011]|nr:hypothetical protein vBEcoMphAPEC6_00120 [Escherichia phage ph0011]
MNTNQVLNEIESIIKPMKRTDAMLTPEECRLYERYSVEQVQEMAMAIPAVQQPENAVQDVTGDYNINPVLGKITPITEEQKDYLSQYLKG